MIYTYYLLGSLLIMAISVIYIKVLKNRLDQNHDDL